MAEKISEIKTSSFTIEVENVSPMHLGSGQADVNVDADVVHDAHGLPYFPGKRFKGLLYESGLEVLEMLSSCGSTYYTKDEWDELFNHGIEGERQLIIPNLYVENYDSVVDQWAGLMKKFPDMFQPSDVLESYTSIRYQTKIDDKTGVAADTSLHNMRVLEAHQKFYGEIRLTASNMKDLEILALAVHNLQQAGLKRNRGFGELKCTMLQDGKDIQKYLVEEALQRGQLV